MFIIDFDDTLFDTQAFKQDRIAQAKKAGCDEQCYEETYRQARKTPDGLFAYSDERHAEMFGRAGKDRDVMLAALQQSTDRLHEFVCEDAIAFLGQLKQFGQQMILLTYGDPAFQELKVRKSGLADYFDQHLYVDLSKEDGIRSALDQKVDEETVWFINDKIEETKDVHAAIPELRCVLKQVATQTQEQYEQSGYPFFPSLTEILHYVQANK